MTTAAATWELEVRDDLFALAHPEDGSEYTASVFYIIATDARGTRYAHDHQFRSAETFEVHDEDGYSAGIRSFREEALAQAEALLAKMKAAQAAGRFTTPVGRDHWSEMDPVYGSEAYIRQEPMLVARERAEEMKALPF